MNSYDSLTIRALRIALGDNDNGALEWANEYGEPGYSAPEKSILLANWNSAEDALKRRWQLRQMRTDVPHVAPGEYHDEQCANRAREAWRRFERRLEGLGYSLEWSDEWYVDSDNSPSKAYRAAPDHHGWESRIRMCDGYVLTPDNDADEWIEDALNEERRPLPGWFDDSELKRHGFAVVPVADQQVGFHTGQNDTPDKFMPALVKKGFDVILQVTDRQQFAVHYRVWTRKEAERGVLFDSAGGIYIPQRFAREMDRAHVTGVSESDYATLAMGPEHPDYWEVWDDVLRLATLRLNDGTRVTLYQDGDVFYTERGAEYCEYKDTYYVHAANLEGDVARG